MQRAALDDTRAWIQDRRRRTKRLIELGGLVHKSGLADRVDDDRATIYGALLIAAERVAADGGAAERAVFRARGRAAFFAEAPPR